MSEPLKVTSPFGSPDSLRAMQQSFKQFYDLHTKMDYGYEDVDGLQYVGTVRNFGSEMLLESRKLRMTRPPYNVIKPSVLFEYYFNITHSDYINTYDQQNMLMACLKPNVCFEPHTYKIRIDDAEEVWILRADGYSEEDVRKHKFLRTYTNPVIIIDDDESSPIELYTGGTYSNADHHITWYISLDVPEAPYYEPIEGEDGSYISVDLKGNEDLPFLWMCSKEMRLLPEVEWVGNEDHDYRPILTNGTNGHDWNLMFPLIYGENNVPDVDGTVIPYDTGFWYFRISGDFNYVDGRVFSRDVDSTIFGIQLCYCEQESFIDQPTLVHDIMFDDTNVKVTLSENWRDLPIFRIPAEGDWDYDGRRYENNPVACIPLTAFAENITREGVPNPIYVALLRLRFDESYFNPYERQVNQMRAGVYIDYTREYSDHGVDKYKGIVYRLAEFDGLPAYYKYTTIMDHRAHVDMYTIRDHPNNRNQKAMEKQTAAIILDAGIPQNYNNAVTPDMLSTIVYNTAQMSIKREYITLTSASTGVENSIADTVFIDGNHFADRYAEGAFNYPRFVYHGNRRFSLNLSKINPDTEYGRGYLLTNDPSTYINNDLEDHYKKAPRTVARICDIPTSFTQLQHVDNIAPTLVLDTYYTRQYAPYTSELRNTIWNERRSKWFISIERPEPHTFVKVYFPKNIIWTTMDILEENGYIDTPPATVSLIDDCSAEISSGGSGYKRGDVLGFNIGGLFISVTVLSLASVETGSVGTFSMQVDHSIIGQPDETIADVLVPIANFNGNPCAYTLETRSGHGSGAVITITIDQSIWNDSEDFTRRTIPDGVYTYYRNSLTGGISVVPYIRSTNSWDMEHSVQITGDLTIGNPIYDPEITRNLRTTENVYLYNMLWNENSEPNLHLQDVTGRKTVVFGAIEMNFDPSAGFTIENLIDGVDLHQFVSDKGMNVWNCMIGLVPAQDRSRGYLVSWYYDLNASANPAGTAEDTYPNGNILFPKRSSLNVYNYDNSYSSIKLNVDRNTNQLIPFMYDIMHKTYDTYVWNKSFMTLTNQQNITIPSLLEIDSSLYPSEAMELHNGSQANFNIYRFNHMKHVRELKDFRRTLSESSNETLRFQIINVYGRNADVLSLYGYTETPYVPDTIYYEGGILLDVSTNNRYLALNTFVAVSLEDDLENNHIKYIGPSRKHDMYVDYIVQRTYSSSQLYDITDLSLFRQRGSSIRGSGRDEYTVLDYKPADWDTNCSRYYKIGTSSTYEHVEMMTTYEQLSGTMPQWLPYMYYRLIGNKYILLETQPVNWKTEYTRYYQKIKTAPPFATGMYYTSLSEEEPFGGYVPLVETTNVNVTAGGSIQNSPPMFVLRIDEPLPSSFVTEYRVYDNGTDISENVLLFVNGALYIFHNNKWELR